MKKAIKNLKARSIIDGIGFPALEVEVETKNGKFRASVQNSMDCKTDPMHIKRDCLMEFGGRHVRKAVNLINTKLAHQIKDHVESCSNQTEIDDFLLKLDGTRQKTQLGSNVCLAISLAILKAGAAELGIPVYTHIRRLLHCKTPINWLDEFKYTMPVPHFDMIIGGVLGHNGMPFHSIYVVPTRVKSFVEAMKVGCEIYHCLRTILIEKFGEGAGGVTAKGAFCPPIDNTEAGLSLVAKAITKANYCGNVAIGLDVKGNHLIHPVFGLYNVFPNMKHLDEKQLIKGEKLEELYLLLIKHYPLCSIDDPFYECDMTNWESMHNRCSVQITGDDLIQSQIDKLKNTASKLTAATVKPIQLGTFTEIMNFASTCHANEIQCIMSHRTGETEDEILADIAVGLGCKQFGAPGRGERTCKYNEIIRIEEEVTYKSEYPQHLFKRFECFKYVDDNHQYDWTKYP